MKTVRVWYCKERESAVDSSDQRSALKIRRRKARILRESNILWVCEYNSLRGGLRDDGGSSLDRVNSYRRRVEGHGRGEGRLRGRSSVSFPIRAELLNDPMTIQVPIGKFMMVSCLEVRPTSL